jgi:hypothetical protein
MLSPKQGQRLICPTTIFRTPNFFVVSSFRNGNIWYDRCNFAGSFMELRLDQLPGSREAPMGQRSHPHQPYAYQQVIQHNRGVPRRSSAGNDLAFAATGAGSHDLWEAGHRSRRGCAL